MRRLIPAAILLLVMSPVFPAPVQLGEEMPDTGTLLELPGRAERLHLSVEDLQISARFVDAEGLLIEPIAESIIIEVNQPGHRHHKWRGFLQPGPDHTSPRRCACRRPTSSARG